MICTFEGIMKE
uniref:Uncharacterized protein n=1 Tax=Anguilla anguilla TaxID=7936 RepID=A0A0E9VW85_ANGAN